VEEIKAHFHHHDFTPTLPIPWSLSKLRRYYILLQIRVILYKNYSTPLYLPNARLKVAYNKHLARFNVRPCFHYASQVGSGSGSQQIDEICINEEDSNESNDQQHQIQSVHLVYQSEIRYLSLESKSSCSSVDKRTLREEIISESCNSCSTKYIFVNNTPISR
jgi:hypothetical protein